MYRRPSAAIRYGYTLMEMLIAVVLVAVLMTTVWGLMSLYSSLQTAGTRVAAEEQLVRSLTERIREDLTAVPLPAWTSSDSEAGGRLFEPNRTGALPLQDIRPVAAGSDSLSELRGRTEEKDQVPGRLEFLGRSDVMRMVICGPPSISVTGAGRADAADENAIERGRPEGAAPMVPEFRMVILQFQSSEAVVADGLRAGLYRVQAPVQAVKAALRNRAASDPDPDIFNAGKDHIRVDRAILEELLFPVEDFGTGAAVRMMSSVCDWIPEVVGGRFEYFDGEVWGSEWEGERSVTVPSAVRVTLDIVDGHELRVLRLFPQSSEPAGRLEQYLDLPRTGSVVAGGKRVPEADAVAVIPRRYTFLVPLASTVILPGDRTESDPWFEGAGG